VIINKALAKKYWPNEDALGKRITFSDARKPDPKWLTIVELSEAFGIAGSISIQRRNIICRSRSALKAA